MSGVSGWEGWAIPEPMGHRRLSDYITEATIGGSSFIRLDVPEAGDSPAATQFYGGSSVYCITPTTEEIATALAAKNNPAPVQRWDLPQLSEGKKEERSGVICHNCEEWADGFSYGDECPNCGARLRE